MAAVSRERLVSWQQLSDADEVPDRVWKLNAEIADPNYRLVLTERAEPILREQLERVRARPDQEWERAELQAEWQQGFWTRLFGGWG